MSAFVCSDEHVMTLAIAFTRLHLPHPNHRRKSHIYLPIELRLSDSSMELHVALERYNNSKSDADQFELASLVANILLKENIKSVNYRYDENDDYSERFELVVNDKSVRTLRKYLVPATLISLANGYIYQSCETKTFYNSIAYSIINRIILEQADVMSDRELSANEHLAKWAI